MRMSQEFSPIPSLSNNFEREDVTALMQVIATIPDAVQESFGFPGQAEDPTIVEALQLQREALLAELNLIEIAAEEIINSPEKYMRIIVDGLIRLYSSDFASYRTREGNSRVRRRSSSTDQHESFYFATVRETPLTHTGLAPEVFVMASYDASARQENPDSTLPSHVIIESDLRGQLEDGTCVIEIHGSELTVQLKGWKRGGIAYYDLSLADSLVIVQQMIANLHHSVQVYNEKFNLAAGNMLEQWWASRDY